MPLSAGPIMIMLLIYKDFIENQSFRFIHFETILPGFASACNRPLVLVGCELPNSRGTSPVGPPAEYKTDPSEPAYSYLRLFGDKARRLVPGQDHLAIENGRITMTRVWVLKTTDKDTGQPVAGVFEELKAGQARMGWSSKDTLDLRTIQKKRDQRESLDEDQKAAVRCLGFLRYVNPGDYIIYPHQPKRGQFSVVKITGEYDYSDSADGLGDHFDFRSFRSCSLEKPSPVNMYDKIVPSTLKYRLGRPGRFSQVHDRKTFFDFLEDLPEAGQQQDGSISAIVKRIYGDLEKSLPKMLKREFARHDLSRKLCPKLFERMGYACDVQEGPYEAGSDLVVTVNSPLLPGDGFTVGVQAFAFEGDVAEASLKRKLDQLLEGWETNSLDSGVLLTTGDCGPAAEKLIEEHNEDNPDRPVHLIGGEELAELFLQHFPYGTG